MHLFEGQIAGRDEVKGGSWLSFASQGGRFACLTNVRLPPAADAARSELATRGTLVTQFVRNTTSCDDYLTQLESTRDKYPGYNIVFGDLAAQRTVWYTNHTKPSDVKAAEAPRVVEFADRHAFLDVDSTYCLSNAATLHAQWPKVLRAKAHFDNILSEFKVADVFASNAIDGRHDLLGDADADEQLFARLFALLADARQPSDDALLPHTGVPIELERALSSICVPQLPQTRYGTVSACVAHVDADGPLHIVEHAMRAPPSTPVTVRHARHMNLSPAYDVWPPVTDATATTTTTTTVSTTTKSIQQAGRLIFVGDVHACYHELKLLMQIVAADAKRDRVVLLGDLVGKGPLGHEVTTFARENRDYVSAIVGNWDFHALQAWRGLARYATLSANVKQALAGLDDADMRYLDSLPYHLCFPEYNIVAVHAGVRADATQRTMLPIERQSPFDLMNMRCVRGDGTVTKKTGLEATKDNDDDDDDLMPWARQYAGPPHVLFGHDALRKLQRHEHATGLDTGCCYGGALTALVLPARLLVQVDALAVYRDPDL